MVKHKIALIGIIIGIWLLKSNLENVITNFIPGNYENWIGILLIIISAHYLGKTQFSFKTMKSWFS